MTKMTSRGGRTIAMIAATILPLALISACGADESDGKTTLTVASYGGPYQDAQAKAFFEPYMKANPDVKIVQDSPSDNAKLRAMVDAGKPQWDVVLLANDFGNESQGKWLEPIDYDVVDKDSLLDGYAGKYRAGADVEGTVLAYREDKLPQAPSSWADFFDTKKFPGKRAVNKFAAGGILEAALLADGVPQAELYPLDVDRALEKIDTIKDRIVWWDTAAQSQQLLESGEVTMGLVWVGRAIDAGKSSPVSVDWNTWLSQDAYWMVPKGTPNAEEAMKLIAYMVSKDPQVEFTQLIDYGTVNREAAEVESVRANPNRPSNHLDTQVPMDDEWWAENLEGVMETFNAWVLT
ncbi:extracellular solute-binding protein [Mumia zhuanghuii]|uniref:Extracellular solute-binding protein n=4 Tax=Mumia zhuanghuii TaxID=2585211 RepID=A0A5C4MIR6_9ACTN|nr:extracellular solute-binding protein [Mumia zhuanghuii]